MLQNGVSHWYVCVKEGTKGGYRTLLGDCWGGRESIARQGVSQRYYRNIARYGVTKPPLLSVEMVYRNPKTDLTRGVSQKRPPSEAYRATGRVARNSITNNAILGSQHPSPNVKTFCKFEPQIWLEFITSRDAKSACFKGSRTSCREINFGIFLAKFWPEKITSRDGCFLPIYWDTKLLRGMLVTPTTHASQKLIPLQAENHRENSWCRHFYFSHSPSPLINSTFRSNTLHRVDFGSILVQFLVKNDQNRPKPDQKLTENRLKIDPLQDPDRRLPLRREEGLWLK